VQAHQRREASSTSQVKVASGRALRASVSAGM